MSLKLLLTEYNEAESMYLRKDGRAIAALTPDEKFIGFLVIDPESKSMFYGKGIILEDKVAGHVMTQALSGKDIFGYPGPGKEIAEFFKPGNEKLVPITEDHVKEFLKKNDESQDKLHNYLTNFSKIPCEYYAADTFRNKIRNTIETVKVRYSPTYRAQRKRLREQIESQLPGAINQLLELLEQIKNQPEEFKEKIKVFEEMMGQKFETLTDMAKQEIEGLAKKKLLKSLKFTGTKPKARYSITSNFTVFSSEGLPTHYRYEGKFKLNC